MSLELDFYFDFISPYTYLANTVLPRLSVEHRAKIHYHPFCLIDLMKLVDNRPTTLECKNKAAYAMADLQRWAAHYHVMFRPNPHWTDIDFPTLGRLALVALDEGHGPACIDALFAAIWSDAANLAQPPVLVGVLNRVGLDGQSLVARATSPDYAERYERGTREAADRGVFGSPTMFVGPEMFFGNDRFDFLTGALERAAHA